MCCALSMRSHGMLLPTCGHVFLQALGRVPHQHCNEFPELARLQALQQCLIQAPVNTKKRRCGADAILSIVHVQDWVALCRAGGVTCHGVKKKQCVAECVLSQVAWQRIVLLRSNSMLLTQELGEHSS